MIIQGIQAPWNGGVTARRVGGGLVALGVALGTLAVVGAALKWRPASYKSMIGIAVVSSLVGASVLCHRPVQPPQPEPAEAPQEAQIVQLSEPEMPTVNREAINALWEAELARVEALLRTPYDPPAQGEVEHLVRGALERFPVEIDHWERLWKLTWRGLSPDQFNQFYALAASQQPPVRALEFIQEMEHSGDWSPGVARVCDLLVQRFGRDEACLGLLRCINQSERLTQRAQYEDEVGFCSLLLRELTMVGQSPMERIRGRHQLINAFLAEGCSDQLTGFLEHWSIREIHQIWSRTVLAADDAEIAGLLCYWLERFAGERVLIQVVRPRFGWGRTVEPRYVQRMVALIQATPPERPLRAFIAQYIDRTLRRRERDPTFDYRQAPEVIRSGLQGLLPMVEARTAAVAAADRKPRH